MAFKAIVSYEVKDMFANELNHFWAISHSVGWGNHNFYEDVILVQYLINKCAGKKVLETDGLFGPKTWNGIKNFQNSIKKAGYGPCKIDGRVTAVDEFTSYTSYGYYTIHMLNWIFYTEKRIYFDDPRRDPDLPTAICAWVSDYF